ncbi:MAG: methylated-DNA--[protein]-cysteine S-methyltransferase [Candidatus Nanopelagicales bacterium]
MTDPADPLATSHSITDLAQAPLATPVGTLWVVAGPLGLRAVLWPGEDGTRIPRALIAADGQAAARAKAHEVLDAALEQLSQYFQGARKEFDLPLDLRGTPFQVRAWEALRAIPYGRTASYGEQARALGAPLAARAVGAANRANPISVIVPCHRVIAAGGSLTGFAGGLARKGWLLEHERQAWLKRVAALA